MIFPKQRELLQKLARDEVARKSKRTLIASEAEQAIVPKKKKKKAFFDA